MSSADMDHPITKREARDIFLTKGEANDLFLTKGEANDLFLTKREFHDVMKNLFEHLDKQFAAANANTLRLVSELEANTQRLVGEMGARFTNETLAVVREVSKQHRADVAKLDERYKDLPDRVTKLETAVFGPAPVKRQRRR